MEVLTKLAFYNVSFPPGIPDDIIEKGRDYKLITEITQDGDDFTWTQLYPANASVTNKFTIGKESDMETIGGKKFKVTFCRYKAHMLYSFDLEIGKHHKWPHMICIAAHFKDLCDQSKTPAR